MITPVKTILVLLCADEKCLHVTKACSETHNKIATKISFEISRLKEPPIIVIKIM